MNRGRHTILLGDCLQTLSQIEPGTVQCAVTSPPYFGLRSYLPTGHTHKHLELGSESRLDDYLANQVAVYRLVRDCLHPTGTLWLNVGDSYAYDGKWGAESTGKHLEHMGAAAIRIGREKRVTGLKAGDMCNVPFALAETMRADGWFWRDVIIWRKPSPMPSSQSGWRWIKCRVKVGDAPRGTGKKTQGTNGPPQGDRNGAVFASRAEWADCPGCKKCAPNGGYVLRKGGWRTTTGHEYIFLFAKSDRYFCDGDAVLEMASNRPPGNNKRHKGRDALAAGDEQMRTKAGLTDIGASETRTPRSVQTWSFDGLRAKHFAAFPSALARFCIRAGTSEGGCCSKCRTPLAPVVETVRVATRPGNETKVGLVGVHAESPYYDHSGSICGNRDPKRHTTATKITAYRPCCRCENPQAAPCIVLDPFLGSGTTAQVATWYGRDAVGCELNPEYVAIAEQRIAEMPRCMRDQKAKRPAPGRKIEAGLFDCLENGASS